MTLHQYYNRYIEAIEAERQEEENYYLNVISKKSIHDKVKNGVAWYPVNLIRHYYSVGEYIEVEIENPNPLSSENRLREGAGVQLFINLHQEITTFRGTVSFLRRNKMRIMLQSDDLDIDDIHVKGLLGVELIYDEKPYIVQKKAIEDVLDIKNSQLSTLRDGIFKRDAFDYRVPVSHFTPLPHLNTSQNEAIKGCIESPNIAIIHGPPGTGKTTTITGLVATLLQSEKQILVAAPSNNAVDLLASKLNIMGLNIVRLGNITRIDDDITHLSLEEKVRRNPQWEQIKKVKIEAEELNRKASKFKRSFGQEERQERYMLRKEAKDLRSWAFELEDRLTSSVMSEAQVILCTLIGASHRLVKDRRFKTCIIDEASQSLVPECWNVMLRAERTILVGDHHQLPPTVKSSKALQLNLDETLLDILAHTIQPSYLLNVQYRMHDQILHFPNHRFYNGRLTSAAHVKGRTLRNDNSPLTFIDTVGTGFEEKQLPEQLSYYNPGEYFILREHLIGIHERALGYSIGIIAPYAEQVRFIRKEVADDELLRTLDLQIDSIDGFQGQEKDIIYISWVRSNDRNDIGFVKDIRRINVGLTRAKSKLVIIGDSATLSGSDDFIALMDYIETQGEYKSAWEYMG